MTKKRIPKIRVGDFWVPAHRMWNVVESIKTANDLVEKFNDERPELATETTLEVVKRVRMRIRDMELSMGGEGFFEDAAAEAGLIDADEHSGRSPAGRGGNDLDGAGEKGVNDGDGDAGWQSAGDGDNAVGEHAGGRGTTEVASPTQDKAGLDQEALADAARQLVEAMSLEEALRMLQEDYGEQIDARDVLDLVGKEAYMNNLGREAKELVVNMIVPEQVAELWNESRYPSPIGGLWTKGDVEALLK
jgi:hypothetical protein